MELEGTFEVVQPNPLILQMRKPKQESEGHAVIKAISGVALSPGPLTPGPKVFHKNRLRVWLITECVKSSGGWGCHQWTLAAKKGNSIWLN